MKHVSTARYGLTTHTARPSRALALARAALWLAVLAFAVYALLALAGVAHAQRPDAGVAAERREFVSVLSRTQWCMSDAAAAGARQGIGERDLTVFVALVCQSALREHLMRKSGFTHREASIVIAVLADREAHTALWGTP